MVGLFLISERWGLSERSLQLERKVGVKLWDLGKKKEHCLCLTRQPLQRNPNGSLEGERKYMDLTTVKKTVEERSSSQVKLSGETSTSSLNVGGLSLLFLNQDVKDWR